MGNVPSFSLFLKQYTIHVIMPIIYLLKLWKNTLVNPFGPEDIFKCYFIIFIICFKYTIHWLDIYIVYKRSPWFFFPFSGPTPLHDINAKCLIFNRRRSHTVFETKPLSDALLKYVANTRWHSRVAFLLCSSDSKVLHY